MRINDHRNRYEKNASARAKIGNILSNPEGFFFRYWKLLCRSRNGMLLRRKKVHRSAAGASLTVEAAWIVPLFFLSVVSLICMMDLFGRYSDRQMLLGQEAERLAVEQGIAEAAGSNYVDLNRPVEYRVKWFPIPVPAVSIPCRGRVRVWSGDAGGDSGTRGGGEGERLVLVTEHGSVYHTSTDCTHISLSYEAVSANSLRYLRNEEGHKYHACEKCARNGHANDTVYVAREGNCYHNRADCSGLVRKVRMIPESEAEGMRECSRCAQREHDHEHEG
ncbi:MAG: hypothetical protein K5744_03565 [Eubacterium sp.]|nr:hypothetical protein [Eubacterium sp.]